MAEKKSANTARVMKATVERLGKIISRLESKIEKVKSRGGNTSESERLVVEAKAHLSEATTSINTFANIQLSGETIKENFERIRTLATEAREHLRATHESLLMAVRALNAVEVETESESDDSATQ